MRQGEVGQIAILKRRALAFQSGNSESKVLVGIAHQAGDNFGNSNISGLLLVEVREGYRLVAVFLIHGHTTSSYAFGTIYKGSCQFVTTNISLLDIFFEIICVIRICFNNFIEHMAYRNIRSILIIIAVRPNITTKINRCQRLVSNTTMSHTSVIRNETAIP